jgi:uncharacterized protein (TIGR00297 family)
MNSFHSLAQQFGLGAVLALLAAGAAYRFNLLTRGGALAAFLLGATVFGLGGWNWALVLIAFFVSSSGLSLLFRKRKNAAEKMYAKSGRRDAAQVLANGGVAGLFVLLHWLLPNSLIPWAGFCAALAAANADTWATELGILNRGKPVLIVSGKQVEPGTSGAVSLTGTLAAVAGAGFIAGLAWLLKPAEFHPAGVAIVFGLIALCGLIGSLMDSFLGATVQAIYFCPDCRKETEKHPRHGCGTATTLLRGKAWINNEWVNLACTLSASLVMIVLCLTFLLG